MPVEEACVFCGDPADDEFAEEDYGPVPACSDEYACHARKTARECPACAGLGRPLGQLGRRAHYRCRDCGLDFSHEEER